MDSDGGGKMRPKRTQSGNKPYDRRSSIFGRFSSSVKDLSHLLIPSWLGGESNDGKTNNAGSEKLSVSDSQLPSEGKGSQLVERLQSTSMLGSGTTSYSSNQDSVHSEKRKDSIQIQERQHDTVGVANQRGNLLSKNNSSSISQLRLSDSFLGDKDTSLSTSEIRPPIMVSTGSFSRSAAQPANKKQKLWSPEFARQGKPMTHPTTDKPAFNSILFGSMNQGNVSLGGDSFGESSFYSGKTRFGGASSARKQSSLNKSLPYQSSLPLRKQVTANKKNSSYQAVTSATAQRILETLDRMSTPLGDAKKIPQPDMSNDSVLSFTPSSYRRTSLLGMNRSVTRPLQLPKGPPTKQYQTASPAEIRRNRYRPSEKDQQSTSSIGGSVNSEDLEKEHKRAFISQEQITVHDNKDSSSSGNAMSSGKIRTKKFSQHISSRIDEEEVNSVPTLRTDFTLPVSSMTPISMPSFPVKSIPKTMTSIPSSSAHVDVSPLKFTFSTPIQKSHGGHDLLNTNGKDFTFSSPIQASKTCAAGAEEAPKWSPEPAIGASCVTSAAFSPSITPVWGNTKAKPKASSPDIGGTSSSFKSYSKWGDNDNSAAAESPGMLAPASSLKQGSVMDILGGGGKKSIGSSSASKPVSNTDDLMAKFRKPAGDWECDTCMIHNNANATKCVACESPKPSSKKTEIPAPKETKLSNVVEISNDLLNKFKPAGNWECDTCMLNNKPEADKCVACEAARPGGAAPLADKANNNLSALFKKPDGNWECDTCMVQNTATAAKCIACESSKPGTQSTSSELKPANGPTASIVKINPGGGFSFNLPPATSATTQGSGGFKFGNTAAKASSASPAATGFVFGQTSTDSKQKNPSESTSEGFKFGSSSATQPVSSNLKKEGLVFGVSSSGSSASSTDNKASQGFQFGSTAEAGKNSSENCVQTSSLFMKSVESEGNKANITAAPSTLGFQFSNTNGPVTNANTVSNLTDSKTEVSNTGQQPISAAVPTFNFGGTSSSVKESSLSTPSFSFSSQPSVTISTVAQITNKTVPGLFSFSSTQQTVPTPTNNTGLGMGKSLSDTTNTPVMNGGFGSFLDTQSAKDKSAADGSKSIGGFGATSPAVFAFGQSTPAAPISTATPALGMAAKRSVDINDTDPSPAKKSAGSQPATNGLFAFGASSTPAFGSASGANSGISTGGFGGFGVPTPKVAMGAAPAAGGGFGFGSSAPGFGQTAQPVAPAFGSSAGQSGGFSFNSTPDFNFSSGSSQGNAPFQFGGNSNVNAAPGPAPAASGVFQFNSTPSANVAPAPVFGAAAPAGTGVGSFSIGSSSDTGRRPMKKAVRKLPKR